MFSSVYSIRTRCKKKEQQLQQQQQKLMSIRANWCAFISILYAFRLKFWWITTIAAVHQVFAWVVSRHFCWKNQTVKMKQKAHSTETVMQFLSNGTLTVRFRFISEMTLRRDYLTVLFIFMWSGSFFFLFTLSINLLIPLIVQRMLAREQIISNVITHKHTHMPKCNQRSSATFALSDFVTMAALCSVRCTIILSYLIVSRQFSAACI